VSDSIVIVGGGPAGLSAARSYRAAGGSADVVLLTDDDRSPYQRPPLSKEYLRGEMSAEELPLETPEWYAAKGVDVIHARVAAIDPAARTIDTDDGRSWSFGGCVLATGSEPQRLAIPGADDDHALLLRSVLDADRIAARVGNGTEVVVIGSGFIGCEAAVSLTRRGANVVLASDEDAPLGARLGIEVGERIAAWLREEGVDLRLGSVVQAIEPASDSGEAAVVRLGVDPAMRADVIVMGAGAKPRVDLARAADLQLDTEEIAVAADAGMRTSADAIYVAGDIAHAHHPLAGRSLRVEHWGDALAQGDVAGRRLAGESAEWEAVPGFWATIGDRTLKHAAWGDGHDDVQIEEHAGDAFTAWFLREGVLVGVLTHDRDEDYGAGSERIARGERVA